MKDFISILIALLLCTMLLGLTVSATNSDATWGEYALVNNIPTFTDAGEDIRGNSPGSWGSEFGRMAKLTNGDWVAVYSIYDNNGYEVDPNGGTRLQISISEDMDVDSKADSLLKLYNKTQAAPPHSPTTPRSTSQSGEHQNSSISAAAAAAKARREEQEKNQ